MNYLSQRMNEVFGYVKPVHVTRNPNATITYGVQDQLCQHPSKASAMRYVKAMGAEYLGSMYPSELRDMIADGNAKRAKGNR